jgi:hypothetical protein
MKRKLIHNELNPPKNKKIKTPQTLKLKLVISSLIEIFLERAKYDEVNLFVFSLESCEV